MSDKRTKSSEETKRKAVEDFNSRKKAPQQQYFFDVHAACGIPLASNT